MATNETLLQIGEFLWEIPRRGKMLVPGRIYADKKSIADLRAESGSNQWDALDQVRNVACLPGIKKASLAMADIHPGYGFPIGGVAAFDPEEGIVTIAGVGFDINCGVRSMVIDVEKDEIERRKHEIADELFRRVPAGMGSTGSMKLSKKDIDRALVEGARFSLDRGYGSERDLEYIEENGTVAEADPGAVSERAKERQLGQIGTLGSGNHYLEVQYVEEVFDEVVSSAFGLREGSIVVSIHTGSRALGHQIGTDYQRVLRSATEKYHLDLPGDELAGAPIKSREGREYISAVKAGINCGFANRQAISGLVRNVFSGLFSLGEEGIRNIYEVGHNNLKFEKHMIDGVEKRLLVHRKGATRAFTAGSTDLPARYSRTGHPVLVGGTMGTSSYILIGTKKGMEETFGSAVHGAGRLKSRTKALKEYGRKDIFQELSARGVVLKTHGKRSAAEEAPGAYKDVDRVVSIMEGAGVNRRVVRLKPIICIKG
ncbi:MAG: RtcB family protein [Candidatus Krumholzibacteriota bacterium]|nr:RtcB family protein [Candidatus Krumholzibacteriota bacterium]